MNRRTILKSILVVPFLPKLLCGQPKEKTDDKGIVHLDFKRAIDNEIYPEKSNYVDRIVFCTENGVIYEGQYMIYTQNVWHKRALHSSKAIRKAKSWKDVMESCKDNTFAGVVKKRRQCPGLVEIYAYKNINGQRD